MLQHCLTAIVEMLFQQWMHGGFPSMENRGELEAMIGAVISGLDGAMAQVAHMPVVHPHIPSTYGILRSMLNFYPIVAGDIEVPCCWGISVQSACSYRG